MDLSCSKMCSVIVTRANVDDSHQERKRNKWKRLPFPNNFVLLLHGILLFLLLPESSFGYYVGPEIGNAPGETRVVKSWGSVPNSTSLAEAAYVPQVYAIGNNAVTFLRSFIPALQPKVDFFAEQIQDTIDTANTKLMQKLENSNNGIIAVENFFTGLMKAVVFGKGPEDDEEKRRVAMRLIRSGGTQDSSSSSSTTTTTSTTSTTTTSKPTTLTTTDAVVEITTGLPILQRSTTSSNKKESKSTSAADEKEEEISTNLLPPKTDAQNARQVCENLASLTGKQFRLLVLESDAEDQELQPYLKNLNSDVSGIWLRGKKSLNSEGKIYVFWETDQGEIPIHSKNFHPGLSIREKRDLYEIMESENSAISHISTLDPWIQLDRGYETEGGRCKSGRFNPPGCEPVKCNVTLPPCETVPRPCNVLEQPQCSVTRPPCTAKCENCTVVPPACYAKPKPCDVKSTPCQVISPPCTVEPPKCETTRPPCRTIQPPCNVTTPPPCTTHRPCIPSFRKSNCSVIQPPCSVDKNNKTVCPPPKTVCQPSYRCPPPEVCQSPAIICPPPLVYCEPANITCTDPVVNCPPPALYCPEPIVNCPEPEIICGDPQVVCSSPVVNCPGVVTSCQPPKLDCPPPDVVCPDPLIECSKPEPCKPPELPPPCVEEPLTTTPRPCPGCGCILMSKPHHFKWDIQTCQQEYHFICEG